MFADIDADIYVLVDGDETYESKCVNNLIQVLINNNQNMVNIVRVGIDDNFSGSVIFGEIVLYDSLLD